jgi:hypothetical protein
MVEAVEGVDKTLRLQLAGAVAGAVTPQDRRQAA